MSVVLAVSLLLQLAAAVLAMRLARRVGRSRGWLLIAAAIFFMAARRAVTLSGVLAGQVEPDAPAEWVALLISVLMLVGIAWLAPLLRSARRAEEVVPQLLESAPDAMVVVDDEDRIVVVNAAAVRLFGYTRRELLGKEVTDLMPDRFRADHLAGFRRYLEHPRPQMFPTAQHLHVKRKDGTEVPVEISVAPLEAASQRLIVGAIRDVSERRRAEMALRESEGRYRSLIDDVLDRSSAAVCILDADRKVVWINRAFTGFFGLERKDVVGSDGRDVARRLAAMVDEGASFGDRLVRAYEENSQVESFECRVRAGDGRWERWLEHRSQPIGSGLYAGGRIDQYADITERKLSEQRIRQFVNIARSMQLGLLVYRLDERNDDRSLRLVIVNPAAERLLGIPKDDMLGRRIDEIFPHLRERGLPALFAEVIRTGATREMRDFNYGDDRVLRNVWAFKAFPLPDDSVGVLFESVATQKRMEELVTHIAQGVAGARGDDFFRSLVRHLAGSLDVEYAFVGEVRNGSEVKSVAFCDHGQLGTDVGYALDGTPCREVANGQLCCHPDHVQQRFPEDKMLADMRAASYVGAPLFDSAGRALGLMVVIGEKPLDDPQTAQSVLRIFAARAAAELERRRGEDSPAAS